MTAGVLDLQAYGVKTTVADLAHFIKLSINRGEVPPELNKAVEVTQTGYFKVGEMIQGLGWEMYAYPTSLETLLSGNSTGMVFEANEAIPLASTPPGNEMLINKTGSTNGFGAYVAFVPSQRVGVVVLANRNYPVPARITLAHKLLTLVSH